MIYELLYEDLTNLGGPMGTERTITRTMGLFNNAEHAKGFADLDYGKHLKWIRVGPGFRTEDLGHVMYHIKLREVL